MPANRNPVLKLLILLGALWLSALAAPVCLAQTNADDRREAIAPSPVLDVVEIHPFRLRTGYEYDWQEGRLFVSDGLLVVLRVDPSDVAVRDTAQRVLYAGDRTVQRLNQGEGSGYVIGIIPGHIDLVPTPVWFGRPELPERVTAAVIRDERALAESAGITPFSPEKISAALRGPIEAADLAALLQGPAADLVLKYSPDEKDLAATWRLPATGTAGPR